MIETKKQYGIDECLNNIEPNIKKLIVCAVLYIREDTDPVTAQKKILRYVKSGDCIGFHSLFLHRKDGSMAKKEYDSFLSGESQIDPLFYDFGQAFLALNQSPGINLITV